MTHRERQYMLMLGSLIGQLLTRCGFNVESGNLHHATTLLYMLSKGEIEDSKNLDVSFKTPLLGDKK